MSFDPQPMPRLLAGRLCLDFANSIEDRLGSSPQDVLRAAPDLVTWGAHTGLLDEPTAAGVRARIARDPVEARATFEGALRLRDGVYGAFAAAAQWEPADRGDLDVVREAYLDALHAARLDPAGAGATWQWPDGDDLRQVLWPVARSAVDLLTSPEVGRVRQCPGTGDCGWLFLDTSRNGTRRWCSMEGCGSRVKMRRAYERKKQRTG